jgi:hypothetical protein
MDRGKLFSPDRLLAPDPALVVDKSSRTERGTL